MSCLVPAQRAPRTVCVCPCGGRNSIRVVVEYVRGGRVDYAGGRYCYVADAAVNITIPEDATPVQAMIYDWHEPDEVVRITFTSIPTPEPEAAYIA